MTKAVAHTTARKAAVFMLGDIHICCETVAGARLMDATTEILCPRHRLRGSLAASAWPRPLCAQQAATLPPFAVLRAVRVRPTS